MLRLSDVYLCYVEACIGAGNSTGDDLALDVFRQIRSRANLDWTKSSISYNELIHERRVEFAFESINFFDIKRMSYRNMGDALSYLNGMKRERQYVNSGSFSINDKNADGMYHGGFTPLKPTGGDKGTPFFLNEDVAPITITAGSLVMPIPAETITKTPSITREPVAYEF